MYIVMNRLPEDIIDIDAGVLKFWKLQSPTRLQGLEIGTHDENLSRELTARTELKAKIIAKRLPNWYLDRILLLRPEAVYIVSRTHSTLDL